MNNKIITSFKEFNSKSSAARSGVINMLIKPISMILSLVYTPLLVAYLGDEKYGLWATLLSIISWVNYFDVGIGNGLRNLLSKEIAQKKYDEAQKSVSTAYVVLTCIASLVFFILMIMVLLLNWNNVLSTQINMRPTLLISFTFICINFVLSLSRILLYALQKSELVSIRVCIIQIINIISLLVLMKTTFQSLEAMAIVFGASSTIVHLVTTFVIIKENKYLKISFKLFEKMKIGEIGRIGLVFFVIQIMALLVFTVDNLIISHYYGASAVTPFSIANKVFYTAYSVLAAFLVPYWSRSTVAFANNDYKWIEKSLNQVLKITCLFICGYIVLLLVFKPVVALWLGRELLYEKGVLEIMCVFYISYSILGVECQFINGSGLIGTQLITYCIAGVINIPLSIFLGVNLGLGSFGVRLASTILVTIQIIVLGFNLRNILMRLKNKVDNAKLAHT